MLHGQISTTWKLKTPIKRQAREKWKRGEESSPSIPFSNHIRLVTILEPKEVIEGSTHLCIKGSKEHLRKLAEKESSRSRRSCRVVGYMMAYYDIYTFGGGG